MYPGGQEWLRREITIDIYTCLPYLAYRDLRSLLMFILVFRSRLYVVSKEAPNLKLFEKLPGSMKPKNGTTSLSWSKINDEIIAQLSD